MREVRGEEFFHFQSEPKFYWQGSNAQLWQAGQKYITGFNSERDDQNETLFERFWSYIS
jgi:hypothetical protein